jgi:hypothetical protein
VPTHQGIERGVVILPSARYQEGDVCRLLFLHQACLFDFSTREDAESALQLTLWKNIRQRKSAPELIFRRALSSSSTRAAF